MIAVRADLEKTNYSVIEGVEVSRLAPRPHHVLIRWNGKKETKGGILIPEDRERQGLMNGEILLVGPGCDDRLRIGVEVQFSFNAEKEFLGSQCPGDRDPVFFMRDESVIGIITKDLKTGKGDIEPVNGCIVLKPELRPFELAGLITVNHDAKDAFFCWGEVVRLDAKGRYDFRVGDVVGYTRNYAEELRLGDFEADVMHVLMPDMGAEVQAVREAV